MARETSLSLKVLSSLNLLVSDPYFFFHFVVFSSYVVVRYSTSLLSPEFADHLFRREIQAFSALAVVLAVKLVREDTWEGFISDSLLYAKIFLMGISLIMNRHLAILYAIIFTVIYIVTQQPTCQELGESNRLTPLQLETVLSEGNASRFWLIEFRASSSSSCVRFSRCLPDLSITYSNKHLSFGVVDLGLFPNAAEKFGISTNGEVGQLPVYIMFEKGLEMTRFPEWNFQAKALFPPLSKRILARHFELDRHLLGYVNGSYD